MNEVIRQLHERKSVRVFTDRAISPEDKSAILMAATQAPTAGNQQMYTIVDITDQGLKEQLAESCDHQPFIATAKMVLIFCADYQKWYDAFLSTGCAPRHPAVGDLMLAVTDAVIAAQNAVVAAQSLGIGSCYIGDIMENCELHRDMLNLPEYVFPAAMLVFGYPTEQQLRREKPAHDDEHGHARQRDAEDVADEQAKAAEAEKRHAVEQAVQQERTEIARLQEQSKAAEAEKQHAVESALQEQQGKTMRLQARFSEELAKSREQILLLQEQAKAAEAEKRHAVESAVQEQQKTIIGLQADLQHEKDSRAAHERDLAEQHQREL